MTLYYIEYCFYDSDNYPCSQPKLEHGLFENEGDALAEAARQNRPAIQAWEEEVKREKKRISDAQRTWDVLSKAGIAKGTRTELHSYYKTHIETGPFRVQTIETIPKLIPFPCQEPNQ